MTLNIKKNSDLNEVINMTAKTDIFDAFFNGCLPAVYN